jgi:hypothetical protein
MPMKADRGLRGVLSVQRELVSVKAQRGQGGGSLIP